MVPTFAEGLDATGATGAGVLGAVGHGTAVYGAPALDCRGHGWMVRHSTSEIACLGDATNQ